MSDPAAARLARLEGFAAQLSAPDPWPDELGEQEQNAWMERAGADSGLAGLISSAVQGARFHPAELREYREASERFGSRLDADSLAETYRLLGRR